MLMLMWNILIVAYGISIAEQGGRRRKRQYSYVGPVGRDEADDDSNADGRRRWLGRKCGIELLIAPDEGGLGCTCVWACAWAGLDHGEHNLEGPQEVANTRDEEAVFCLVPL